MSLGGFCPLITDIYISRAFFEVIRTALQVIVTWNFIVRLVTMLDGLEDKVKRPLLIQKLSNVCHLEYRRAQMAFQREMSLRPGVAGYGQRTRHPLLLYLRFGLERRIRHGSASVARRKDVDPGLVLAHSYANDLHTWWTVPLLVL